MVSNDNGATWNVLYTLNYPASAPTITKMKLLNNGTSISFIQTFSNRNTSNKLVILDLQSLNIIKEFSFPQGEGVSKIRNYSIFDDGTLSKVTFITDGTYTKFFSTTDGGSTWTKVYDGHEHEDVILNDAAMSSTNPQKFYIARNGGPGNVDGGFLTSIDAGTTWTETLNGLILESIEVDSNDGDIIYVGTGVRWSYPTQRQAVYKSTDGGTTFTEMTGITWQPTGGGLKNVPKIEINPNDHTHVVVLADEELP